MSLSCGELSQYGGAWFLSKLFNFYDSGQLPFISLSAISPHVLHQTERSLSHAYGHIQTLAIANVPT